MRLFISSYRAGKHTQDLLDLLGPVKKIAFISNAKDYKTPEERDQKMVENFEFWNSIGIEPEEIDLRPYFNKPGAEKLLDNHLFVWLGGGNAFMLRRALSYSGLDKYLTNRARNNSLILGGESAGAIVIGPTLEGSEMETDEDSPNYVAEPYQKEIIWNGLGLVDFIPVPHYQTSDYGDVIQKYIDKLEKTGIPYKTMTDDQAILINDKQEKFLE